MTFNSSVAAWPDKELGFIVIRSPPVMATQTQYSQLGVFILAGRD